MPTAKHLWLVRFVLFLGVLLGWGKTNWIPTITRVTSWSVSSFIPHVRGVIIERTAGPSMIP